MTDMRFRDLAKPHMFAAVGLSMMLWSVALANVIGVWQSPWLIGCALVGFAFGVRIAGDGD